MWRHYNKLELQLWKVLDALPSSCSLYQPVLHPVRRICRYSTIQLLHFIFNDLSLGASCSSKSDTTSIEHQVLFKVQNLVFANNCLLYLVFKPVALWSLTSSWFHTICQVLFKVLQLVHHYCNLWSFCQLFFKVWQGPNWVIFQWIISNYSGTTR